MSAATPILLEGAPNFRDLGGIPVAGGRIAAGRLYRSEGLQELTDADVATLGDLGVRLVLDLRTPWERETHPSRWPEHAVPALLGADGGHDLRTLRRDQAGKLYADAEGGVAREFLLRMYREFHVTYGPLVGDFVRRITDDGELPAVVHCAAGKDRTGFVIAIVLLAIGTPVEVVEEEYERSDAFFGAERLRPILVERVGSDPPAGVLEAFRTDIVYLRAALDAVEDEHGSVEAYLRSIGVDDVRRRRLRAALVA